MNGLLSWHSSNGHRIIYGYDPQGREIFQEDSNGFMLFHRYNAANNRVLSDIIAQDAMQLRSAYTYDIAGRLSTVTTNNELLVTYIYNANGMVIGRVYGNGTRTDYTLNAAGLVTTVTNRRGTTVLSSFAYTYYLDGNIQSVTENMAGETRVITYAYDLTRRLTREQEVSTRYGTTIRTYTFDNRGNRFSTSIFGAETGTTFFGYDLNNRLLIEMPTVGEPTVYTYDANGNQLTRTTGNHVETRTYNAFNQLTSVTSTGMTAVYNYRADGLRMSKTINGVTTTHLWNGANIVLEFNANRAAINRFYRSRSGRLLRSHQHGWYLHNVRGDVVQRANAAGIILHNYRYSAFGTERDNSAQNTNPFRFAGEYWDWEREEYYLRARSFNPRIGRFTQPDPWWGIHNMQDSPIAILQAANLFVFAINNPVRWIDPTGLAVKPANPQLNSRERQITPPCSSSSSNASASVGSSAGGVGFGAAGGIVPLPVPRFDPIIPVNPLDPFQSPAPTITFPSITDGWRRLGNFLWDALFPSSPSSTVTQAQTVPIQDALSGIASQHGLFGCQAAADAMHLELTARGYTPLWAEFGFTGFDYPGAMTSTVRNVRGRLSGSAFTAGTIISTGGYHVGMTFEGHGLIHCNIFPGGLPSDDWFIAFTGPGFQNRNPGTTTPRGPFAMRGLF